MFIIEYYNEREMLWKGAGSGTFYDKSQANKVASKNAAMSDGLVRFRVTSAV